MKNIDKRPLFIFDIANNHQGDVSHGLKIINEVHEACKGFDFGFGFKFQYRDLDTFIHPDFKGRTDIKYVKRFSETRLDENDHLRLKNEADKFGFISVCTPFDENSVRLVEKHGFDIIKVASCSFTDWPLLERIAKADKPVIASTAGVELEDIDKVVSFFEHRNKKIVLMHCVAEYPVQGKDLQLNQIDLLSKRYAKVEIGYSTHESPDNFNAVKIAIAKGAKIFEKHVGIKTDSISLNAYSATPDQIKLWLASAKEALEMCGVSGERYKFLDKELKDLRDLKRGVFAKVPIKKGEKIDQAKVFYAIPSSSGQITANDMSKYNEYTAATNIGTREAVTENNTSKVETRSKIYAIVTEVKKLLKKSNVVIPGKLDFEISYQYGLDKFEKYGGVIINFINRDYCKKIIILLPGQTHPEQHHKLKEETFNILFGKVLMKLNGAAKEYGPGDSVLVEKRVKHEFSSKTGAVIEEISSTHFKDDSYYTDPEILKNNNRKTYLTFWIE